MGVAAALFVILIIPELWKNRSCECMEIEAASYYSLKQVYAARMLLFGVTDVFLITLFLGTASAGLNIGLSELVVQFLFRFVLLLVSVLESYAVNIHSVKQLLLFCALYGVQYGFLLF